MSGPAAAGQVQPAQDEHTTSLVCACQEVDACQWTCRCQLGPAGRGCAVLQTPATAHMLLLSPGEGGTGC